MNAKCCECQQANAYLQILLCGHFICKDCLPVCSYSKQIIVTCTQCHIMTILSNQQKTMQVDPDNFIVCLQCRSQLMSTRAFLQSQHRKHQVATVSKVVHEVQKNLRKYQLSLDIENKALYDQVQLLSSQKKDITDQYSNKSLQIKNIFNDLKHAVAQAQKACTDTYQQFIIEMIENIQCQIKQTRSQILKCESYIQSIDYSLVRSNGSNYVFAANFYFQNIHYLQQLMDELSQNRKKGINSIVKQVQISSPSLQQIIQTINKVRNIDFWAEQVKQIQQSKSVKANAQNNTDSYFERKRRQIFNYCLDIKTLAQTQIAQSQLKLSKISKKEEKDLYNIEERIENLRKTLKLGNGSAASTKSNLSLSYNIR